MNIEVKDLLAKITPLLSFLKRYVVVLFFVVVCGVYGFLVFHINNLTQADPAPEAVTEKLKTVPRPRIDQTAVDKMKQLEEENIEVQTLFKQARDNPFTE